MVLCPLNQISDCPKFLESAYGIVPPSFSNASFSVATCLVSLIMFLTKKFFLQNFCSEIFLFFTPCLTVLIVPTFRNISKNDSAWFSSLHGSVTTGLTSSRKSSIQVLKTVQLFPICFDSVSIQASNFCFCIFSKKCSSFCFLSAIIFIFLCNYMLSYLLYFFKMSNESESWWSEFSVKCL